MKRKNRSRLTKTDVNAICELQRTIDTYETVIALFLRYSFPKTPASAQVPELHRGLRMDVELDWLFENIRNLKKENEELKAENLKLKNDDNE